jgi:hypothetical protein
MAMKIMKRNENNHQRKKKKMAKKKKKKTARGSISGVVAASKRNGDKYNGGWPEGGMVCGVASSAANSGGLASMALATANEKPAKWQLRRNALWRHGAGWQPLAMWQ